jgi:N-acyl-D-amino-acid deacylase
MFHPVRVSPVVITALVLAVIPIVTGAQERYDLLLRNGLIVDGSGAPPYRGDVAIRGDQVARIAAQIAAPATRVVDVGGRVIAPGFIDIHVHATRGAESGIFAVPTADNYVRQGVTTIMDGPDGGSPVPVGPFLAKLDALQKSINIGTFLGQGSVREAVIGLADRPATAAELDRMRSLVAAGMSDGAFGLSSGLFYVPGIFTPTEEVVDLARVAARGGGIYISHMRDETSRVLASVEETILIGERGGLPTQVTHHKVSGRPNWGRSVDTLRLIDQARARGVDATLDVYPYTASSTTLAAGLLPPWVLEGGRARMLERLKDPAARARARTEAVRIINEERGGGDPKNVVVSRCDAVPSAVGKNLSQLTRERGVDVTTANAADTLLQILEQDDCRGVFHAMDEADVDRIIRHPAAMIGSDGEIPVFGRNAPHPRSYGTFARVLSEYVRNRRVLTLAQAVRKMAALPAARLGLTDRGVLKNGMKADLAIFDPATVRDAATYENPHQYAEGFSHVVVNGVVVFEEGRMTAARPGRTLRAPRRVKE